MTSFKIFLIRVSGLINCLIFPCRIDLHQLSEAEGLARAADVPVAVEHTVVVVSRGAISIGTKRKLGYKLATEKPEPILNEQAAEKRQ